MKSSTKYRIFLFLCLFMAGVILFSVYQLSCLSETNKTNSESRSKQEKQEKQADFVLREKDGVIEVYTYPDMQLYEQMQVEENLLPGPIREKLKTGYYLPDKAALFDFLENYSS